MIYFMRHGQSEANAKGLFAGQRDDSKLTEKGRTQARQAATSLTKDHIKVDRIITSPLERTKTTAAIMAADLGLPLSQVTIEPKLIEYDMGGFTGTPIHPLSSAELTAHPETEDPNEFAQRVKMALQVASQLPGTTLVISHDGVGRMIKALQEDVEPLHFYDLAGFPNAHVVKLELPAE